MTVFFHYFPIKENPMLALVNVLLALFMKNCARYDAKKCFKNISNNKEAEIKKKHFHVF